MPKLIVKSGPGAGTEIEIKSDRFRLGRSEECDVVLADPNVSRVHAELRLCDGVVTLYDCHSSNGTYVNGIPVSRMVLSDGDEIRTGQTTFEFVASAAVASGTSTEHTTPPSALSTPAFRRSGEELASRKPDNTTLLRHDPAALGPDILTNVYLKLKSLFHISAEIAQSSTLRDMVDAVARSLLLAVGVDRVTCYLRSESSEAWEIFQQHLHERLQNSAASLPSLPGGFIVRAAEHPAEPQIGSWDRDGKFTTNTAAEATAVAVALSRRDRVLAVICADSPVSRLALAKDDIDFLATLVRHVALRIDHIERLDSLRQENLALRQRCGEDYAIVTDDEKMKQVLELARRVADTDSTVLLVGETGTGKELVARAIHNDSRRRSKPFVAVNCAALPDTLLESELFGHEKGAFTGALERRIGKFEFADGGTLFLDEIGDISAAAQAKLLRVLQEGEIQRLGSNKTIKVNVRVIAATNKNLAEEVKKGTFRQDLYYRIRVVEIALPPLRHRPNDIPVLANYFLRQLRKCFPTPVKSIAPETLRYLSRYPFPGNVRELKNIIERALVLASGDVILPQHLPIEVLEAPSVNGSQEDVPVVPEEGPKVPVGAEAFTPKTLAELERAHIIRTLEYVGGNKFKAATLLGISRTTLYEKLKEYHVSSGRGENEHEQ